MKTVFPGKFIKPSCYFKRIKKEKFDGIRKYSTAWMGYKEFNLMEIIFYFENKFIVDLNK